MSKRSPPCPLSVPELEVKARDILKLVIGKFVFDIDFLFVRGLTCYAAEADQSHELVIIPVDYETLIENMMLRFIEADELMLNDTEDEEEPEDSNE